MQGEGRPIDYRLRGKRGTFPGKAAVRGRWGGGGGEKESGDGHKLPGMEAEQIVMMTIKRWLLSLWLSHESVQEQGVFNRMCHQCVRWTRVPAGLHWEASETRGVLESGASNRSAETGAAVCVCVLCLLIDTLQLTLDM